MIAVTGSRTVAISKYGHVGIFGDGKLISVSLGMNKCYQLIVTVQLPQDQSLRQDSHGEILLGCALGVVGGVVREARLGKDRSWNWDTVTTEDTANPKVRSEAEMDL